MLANKSTKNRLTPEEREEYETYVRTSRFIAVLQAQARKFLSQPRLRRCHLKAMELRSLSSRRPRPAVRGLTAP
jgi:hypothetical protein